MIPPPQLCHQDECQNMVGWVKTTVQTMTTIMPVNFLQKNTFNMRQVNLMNLAAHHLSLKGNSQSQHVISCMQNACISSPIKSLELLRKNLQTAINKDIDHVMKKYIEKFFHPAMNNIRNNCGRDSVNEEHIKETCCKILENAKSMYAICPRSRDSSPYDYSDSETGSIVDYKFGRPLPGSPLFQRKRKESDTDSETSHSVRPKKTKTKPTDPHLTRLLAKRDGPKWNPERIGQNTLFIMGAKANKALGYGQNRGRLYVRHPELMRYSGDQEDKEWLTGQHLMPPTGGKAYLMILDDIQELAHNDDYKNSPNLQIADLIGFEVPGFILNKVKTFMDASRTDAKLNIDLFDFQTSQSMTPPSTALDSAPSTPSDTLQMLESQPTSKQSDTINLIQIPEVSPGSTHSFLSGALTRSPLSSRVSMSVSPHVVINLSQQHTVTSSAQLSMVTIDPKDLSATHITEHNEDDM